jgi:hypothetical protein
VPWLSFFVADIALPWVSLPVYRKGLRRAWGEAMAPPDARVRRWWPLVGVAVALVAGVGACVGMRLGRRK